MDTNSAALSKHAQKKLAKQQYKKQMKAEHHAKAHEVMLQQASRLRAQLQQDQTSAVPESALYAQLPRESACELFAALGDSAIERSVLFQRQPKPSWTSGGSPASASTDAANVAGSTDAADVGANAGMPDKASVASANARACHVLGHFLWRAAKYNEKYAPQELSLLYQLYRLGGPKCDLVIDIGAGNANLSCLIALAFDVPVVCVEMESPRPELRGEAWLPPQLLQRRAVTRVERRIQDYALPDGYERVLVLGKHLCGPGTDAGIDFVRQHRARILGCVFATCCCCKIVGGLAAAGGTGTTLFSELYFGGGGGDAGTGPACQPCEEEEQGVREGSGPESRKRPSPPPSSSSPPAADANADADAVADAATDATASAAAATDAVAAAATTMSRKEAARARDAARLLAAKELARQAGKQLCRRFLRYGDCPDGTSCRFHHCTAEELEAAEAGSVANLAADADEGLGLFRRYRAAEEPTAAAAGGGVSAALPALSEAARPAFLRRALPDVARATSWRNAVFNAKHRQTEAYAAVLEEAEYFESWIQGFRRRRLAELFGHEEELLFCADDVHSQQNRCLVSGERLAPRSAPADAMDQDDDEAATPGPGLSAPVELAAPFFALLERQLLKYEAVLPMDLRVRGLVSTKYGYDGSELPWEGEPGRQQE